MILVRFRSGDGREIGKRRCGDQAEGRSSVASERAGDAYGAGGESSSLPRVIGATSGALDDSAVDPAVSGVIATYASSAPSSVLRRLPALGTSTCTVVARRCTPPR